MGMFQIGRLGPVNCDYDTAYWTFGRGWNGLAMIFV